MAFKSASIISIARSICRLILCILFFLNHAGGYTQENAAPALTFDFNEHKIREKDNKVNPKGYSVLLVNDRFGNEKSAVYTDYLALHLDGELQGRSEKKFRTKFQEGDSVIIGNSLGITNSRYTMAVFDDIRIYHRASSEREIDDLYHEPNPNRGRELMPDLLKYGSIIFVLIVAIVLLIIRNRRNLKKQKEQFDLINHVTELELKVVKAQINPHFISNCLAAIQELIYVDVEKAGQYIARFSYFLRQVLNYSDKNYIRLSEELEIARLNVELEQLRFKGRFDFKLEIGEEVDRDQLIPALITQPFIENAVWHGLLPLSNGRTAILTIRVSRKERTTCIEIEDNGVGRVPSGGREEVSKGTRLVLEKIESLNRLSTEYHHQVEIIGLKDPGSQMAGTKVVICIQEKV